jgi:transcription antitermination factor NusG
MPQNAESNRDDSLSHWHCLRTQIKREHIAASFLRQVDGIDVFCPRINILKKTRAGKKRFIEALFPGYIFAEFNYAEQRRLVMHTQGVTSIVENGSRRVVPEDVIAELKASLGDELIEAPDPSLEVGAKIEFVSGSLKGLNGKVLARLTSGDRVKVLLDFLGRDIEVTTDPSEIMLDPEGT